MVVPSSVIDCEQDGICWKLMTSTCLTYPVESIQQEGDKAACTSPPPDVLKPHCPSRTVVERLGDRWTLLVLMGLRAGPVRFTVLRDMIGVVTPKVLTQTLRALERDGIVTRAVYAEIPPRVEYQLTDLGLSLMGPVDAIREWSEANCHRIIDARSAADSKQTA